MHIFYSKGAYRFNISLLLWGSPLDGQKGAFSSCALLP